MSLGGAMQAFNDSMRSNRDLKRNRRHPFNKDKQKKIPSHYGKGLVAGKVSGYELTRIREELITERKRNKYRLLFSVLISVGIAFSILFILFQLIRTFS